MDIKAALKYVKKETMDLVKQVRRSILGIAHVGIYAEMCFFSRGAKEIRREADVVQVGDT